MSLAPGTILGPYEIQAALGAGGMGEVYRARDTRLDLGYALIAPRRLAEGTKNQPDKAGRPRGKF